MEGQARRPNNFDIEIAYDELGDFQECILPSLTEAGKQSFETIKTDEKEYIYLTDEEVKGNFIIFKRRLRINIEEDTFDFANNAFLIRVMHFIKDNLSFTKVLNVDVSFNLTYPVEEAGFFDRLCKQYSSLLNSQQDLLGGKLLSLGFNFVYEVGNALRIITLLPNEEHSIGVVFRTEVKGSEPVDEMHRKAFEEYHQFMNALPSLIERIFLGGEKYEPVGSSSDL